jgi:hypothetical protein
MKSFVAAVTLALCVPQVIAVSTAHALCMAPRVGDSIQSKDATGAALVITRDGSNPATAIDTLTFRVDGKPGSFDKVVLAPGLVAYRLPAGATSGEVDGGKGGVANVTAIDAKSAALAAPKLKGLVIETTIGLRRSNTVATATIEGTAPDGVVAIVVTDAKGTALSWGHARAGSATHVVLARGGCGALPNGTVAPAGGQAVKVFWVDVNGRASPASNAVKVVAKTNKVN